MLITLSYDYCSFLPNLLTKIEKIQFLSHLLVVTHDCFFDQTNCLIIKDLAKKREEKDGEREKRKEYTIMEQ